MHVFFRGNVRVPWSTSDVDDVHWLPWTRQPDGEVLACSVLGGANEAFPRPASATAQDAPLTTDEGPASGMRLRDYQTECVEAVLRAWQAGTKAPLVVLPTGAGKTIIAAEIMGRRYASRGGRSIFLAHRKELLHQTAEKIGLVTADGAPSIGLVQASNNQLGRAITLASIQTLSSTRSTRLQQVIDAGPYDVVFCDEAHHAVSRQWRRVLDPLREAFPDINIAGLTATPGRADGTALDSVFDEVVFERNLFDMIREGYLVPPKGYSVRLDIDLDEIESSGGDFVTSQLSKVLNTPLVNRAAVEAWRGNACDRKTIVFAVDVDHSTELAKEFRDAGYRAEVVWGAMKSKDRMAAFKRFRDNETKILVNCDLAVEGFDEPSVEAIQFVRPTQSQSLFIQALGRGLRLFPGKTECLVIDCVGNSTRHRPVQLATLSGFDPEEQHSEGTTREQEGALGDEGRDAEVLSASASAAREIVFDSHRRSLYQWRETSVGWAIQIPRIGYYLVAWAGPSHQRATIRYYDQRPGKRDTPAVEILRQPVSFEMAYGLVDAEVERIFSARERRSGEFQQTDEDNAESTAATFVDLDDGMSENLGEAERIMLRDATWRSRPTTAKQGSMLANLGVKRENIPPNAGEASDLITVLRIERDAKRRMPATDKQRAFLERHNIEFDSSITKGHAARLIWQERQKWNG